MSLIKKMNLNFIIYGAIIALVIIVVWVIHAYNYRTSMERLCRLAVIKYMPNVAEDIQSKYVILCDEKLSKYDSGKQKLHAVFTFDPDALNQDLKKLPNVSYTYDIVTTGSKCEFDAIGCAETNASDCIKPNAKQKIVKASTCININSLTN